MIKALMFENGNYDEPSAWGDYPTGEDALSDMTTMAIKALPINAEPGESAEFEIKFIGKNRKSTDKYTLTVHSVPVTDGVRNEVKSLIKTL